MPKKIKKKVNPRRKPATQADIKRVKKRTTDDALNLAMALMLTVLLDKEGYDKAGIQRVWGNVNDLSGSVAKGYVNLHDLRKTLNDEYDIVI